LTTKPNWLMTMINATDRHVDQQTSRQIIKQKINSKQLNNQKMYYRKILNY